MRNAIMVIGISSGTREVSNKGTTHVSMPSPTRFAPPLKPARYYTRKKHVTIGWRQEGSANHHVGEGSG